MSSQMNNLSPEEKMLDKISDLTQSLLKLCIRKKVDSEIYCNGLEIFYNFLNRGKSDLEDRPDLNELLTMTICCSMNIASKVWSDGYHLGDDILHYRHFLEINSAFGNKSIKEQFFKLEILILFSLDFKVMYSSKYNHLMLKVFENIDAQADPYFFEIFRKKCEILNLICISFTPEIITYNSAYFSDAIYNYILISCPSISVPGMKCNISDLDKNVYQIIKIIDEITRTHYFFEIFKKYLKYLPSLMKNISKP